MTCSSHSSMSHETILHLEMSIYSQYGIVPQTTRTHPDLPVHQDTPQPDAPLDPQGAAEGVEADSLIV